MSADTGSDTGNPRFTAEDIPPNQRGPDFDYFRRGDGFRVPDDPGEIIDGVIIEDDEDRSRLKSDQNEVPLSARAEQKQLDRDVKTTPPDATEWLDFFSNILIRAATDFYIDYAFRGIDEELLTPREIEKIHLTRTERDRISRPLSEFASKAKFMRKHGRVIISSAGSIDSLLQLGMWFSRTTRIAQRYQERAYRQAQGQMPVAMPVPPTYPNGSMPDVRTRQDQGPGTPADVRSDASGGRDRPNIGGPIEFGAGGFG